MTNYVTLGSVSSGTMRPEDLIPAFIDALDDIRARIAAPGATTNPPAETMARVAEVGRLDDLLGEIERRKEAEDYYDSKEAGWDLESLFEELNKYAPPYTYFGASEGDGADYGFWIAWDSLEDDIGNEVVIKLPAGDNWPDFDKAGLYPEYVLEVSDHGNATLYDMYCDEVWSV